MLLVFLSLIFETLNRPDLLGQTDILNLCLVNKETKACIEEIAPFTRFRLHVADLPALFRRSYVSERLETLEVTFSGLDLSNTDVNSCLCSLLRPLPQLTALKIPHMNDLGAELRLYGPPCWPALTYLELGDDLDPDVTLRMIGQAPLAALKELRYSSDLAAESTVPPEYL
jgi:hypothetical protein